MYIYFSKPLRLLYFTQIFIYFSKPLRLLYSLIIYEIVNFSFFTLYSLLLLSFFLYLKSVPIYVIVHVHVHTSNNLYIHVHAHVLYTVHMIYIYESLTCCRIFWKQSSTGTLGMLWILLRESRHTE